MTLAMLIPLFKLRDTSTFGGFIVAQIRILRTEVFSESNFRTTLEGVDWWLSNWNVY